MIDLEARLEQLRKSKAPLVVTLRLFERQYAFCRPEHLSRLLKMSFRAGLRAGRKLAVKSAECGMPIRGPIGVVAASTDDSYEQLDQFPTPLPMDEEKTGVKP